ncbi:MAG: indole-3-glycerol-phosphate synthase [Thermoguttaceae bacterium]|jgi:indole-3-glycerol phosphate synthase|nr:indole-3-glycerol-phosphate synthase [Thermoguttaceae bacterium]
MSSGLKHRTFSAALADAAKAGRAPVISEIKCRSPKEGDLLAGRDPALLAAAMESAGAACLSVVTEPEHFGGSLQLLRTVVAATSLPVLRKDFLESVEDVEATQNAGASCLLLIASLMDWPTLVALHREAHRQELETVVEVHNEDELRRALTLDLDLLGINNRDIRRLEVDDGTVANTLELLAHVPPGIRAIGESAISTAEEVRAALDAGAQGVLVGTSILRAPDAGAAVRRLVSLS